MERLAECLQDGKRSVIVAEWYDVWKEVCMGNKLFYLSVVYLFLFLFSM